VFTKERFSGMDARNPPPTRPFWVSDWLELGHRLTPEWRKRVLCILEQEQRRIGASRQSLRRAEQMVAEGQALIAEIRDARRAARLNPAENERMMAVIDLLERTQTLIVSHRDRIADERRRSAGLLGSGNDDES
jgi:hypothetical protein